MHYVHSNTVHSNTVHSNTAHSHTPGTRLNEYDDAADNTTSPLSASESKLDRYEDDEVVTAPWPPYNS
jgi:hypothetical protein